MEASNWTDIVQAVAVSLAALGATFAYLNQVVQQNIANLNLLWQQFLQDDRFARLFILMDVAGTNPDSAEGQQALAELAKQPAQDRIAYVAFLSQVWVMAAPQTGWRRLLHALVPKQKAKFLFRWHFHYLYGQTQRAQQIQSVFWNMYGNANAIQSELNKNSWQPYRKFANAWNPELPN